MCAREDKLRLLTLKTTSLARILAACLQFKFEEWRAHGGWITCKDKVDRNHQIMNIKSCFLITMESYLSQMLSNIMC